MAAEKAIDVILGGNTRVVVEPEKISKENVEELTEAIAEVRRKHSIVTKYPFEVGETREEWSERVSKTQNEESLRVEGETPEEHIKRLATLNDTGNIHKMVPDMLNAVTFVFNNKSYDVDLINKANWIKLKRFLYEVLVKFDIPAEDLNPSPLGK